MRLRASRNAASRCESHRAGERDRVGPRLIEHDARFGRGSLALTLRGSGAIAGGAGRDVEATTDERGMAAATVILECDG